jgi:mono/diheme cytochrome c family protein
MWPRRFRSIVTLTAAAMLAGPVAAQPERGGEVLARGRSLVVRNCGLCHAVGSADVSPRSGAPAFRDLSQRYPVEALGEALAEGILTGHPEMPEFRFAPRDVAAILAYLESLQVRRRGGPALTRGDSTDGN